MPFFESRIMSMSNDPLRNIQLDRRQVVQFGSGLTLATLAGQRLTGAETIAANSLPHEEYAKHDACELAELVQKKEVSSGELLDAAIARAEAVNGTINAIVVKLYNEASDAIKRGLPEGPFTGVPFLVKDLGFAMKGVNCTSGSKLYQDYCAEQDDVTVRRIRRSGFVIFGRTHSPEFGLTATSESALHGETCNPWDHSLSAGGSSGGSAAAVATGMVPMATGTDGGGSIRIPASCCGLFGLKPTRGRVPFGPNVYELVSGLAVAGGVSRSVRDSAALLDVIGGAALGDAYGHPSKERPYLDEVKVRPGKLSIGFVSRSPSGIEINSECLEAVEEARQLCIKLGHQVKDVTQQFVAAFKPTPMPTIWRMTLRLRIESRMAELGRDLRDDEIEPITRASFDAAANAPALALERERQKLHAMSRRMAEFQRDYDVLLMPTLGQKPVPLGHLALSREDVQAFYEDLSTFNPFCVIANQTGQPAMSVPLYWTKGETPLPIGVQFFGRFGDEATLFRLAAQLETARPWAEKRVQV
jgi:amidase/6-aminohexanoate-cyclic-dimer hydrolase